MEVETARLLLRRPRLADVPALHAFLGDAQAMRWTRADPSPRATRRQVAVHEWRRRRDGYAPWTVEEKATGRIIGWGGLYQDPFDPGWGVELGYFFHPGVWSQGYGTELARAALRLADGALRLPEVRAFAHMENVASRRLLERCGFALERHVPEIERLLFRRLPALEAGVRHAP